MLRYNRKSAKNHGVASARFPPAALALAPKALPFHRPFVTVDVNNRATGNDLKTENFTNNNSDKLAHETDGEREISPRELQPKPRRQPNDRDEEKVPDRASRDAGTDRRCLDGTTSRRSENAVVLTTSSASPSPMESARETRSDRRIDDNDAAIDSNHFDESASTLPSLLESPPPPPPLACDDRSIANIECLGLRLVQILSNISSVETLVHGVAACPILHCVKKNLLSLISGCLQRLVSGIDGGFRRWKELIAASTQSVVQGGFAVQPMDTPTIDDDPFRRSREEGELTTKNRGSRHVFMIRHGHYFSKERSDRHKRLTSLGREQLVLTGRRLQEVGFEYDAIVSSTMTRAKESANIIVDQLRNGKSNSAEPSGVSQLSLAIDKLLEEGAPLPPEPPLDFWQPDAAQFRTDGPRIERAFLKYFAKPGESQEKDSHEIIVCHANVIRYCVCRALQVPPQAWLRMWLNHGSITWLTIRPEGRIVLRALGASGYMPPEKLTAN